MATFLLTWNPERWEWVDLGEEVAAVRQGQRVPFQWSTGNTKRIAPGDQLYILKQGKEPRGIFGVGKATSEVFEDDHFDPTRAGAGDQSLYVKGEWNALLNPLAEELLPLEVLQARVPRMYWAPAASGFPIADDDVALIESLWQEQLRRNQRTLYPDEAESSGHLREGSTQSVLVNMYERNAAARAACIAHYGVRCQACDLDFEERYGKLGEGFIHVHHLKRLSEIGAEYVVHPIRDLRPVCPNCHAMIHQQEPPLTIEQLKRRLR